MALIHFIEQEMFNRGKDRFFANIARLKEQRNEGGTTYGKMLLKRGIAPLAAAITAFMEKANSGTAGRRHMAVALLKDIAPDVAAFITLRTAIAPLTSEPMLQNVAVRVGREIEAELRLSNLKQNDADRYAMPQRYIQGHKSRKYRSTVLRYAYGKSTTVDFEPWPRRPVKSRMAAGNIPSPSSTAWMSRKTATTATRASSGWPRPTCPPASGHRARKACGSGKRSWNDDARTRQLFGPHGPTPPLPA